MVENIIELERVTAGYPDAEILPCSSVPECIEKVLDGKADFALAHTSVLEQYSKNYNKQFNMQICKIPCSRRKT